MAASEGLTMPPGEWCPVCKSKPENTIKNCWMGWISYSQNWASEI